MATLQGVYTASVLDNRDREGQARVMVRVPGVAETGIWARLATMMAGRGGTRRSSTRVRCTNSW